MSENAISRLNTLTQAVSNNPPPVYTETVTDDGSFGCTVSAIISGDRKLDGSGQGKSKKDAKLAAATNALNKLTISPPGSLRESCSSLRNSQTMAFCVPSTHELGKAPPPQDTAFCSTWPRFEAPDGFPTAHESAPSESICSYSTTVPRGLTQLSNEDRIRNLERAVEMLTARVYTLETTGHAPLTGNNDQTNTAAIADTQTILGILRSHSTNNKPANIKPAQIAQQIGCERRHVTTQLHALRAQGRVMQDPTNYGWSLKQ